MSLLSSSIVIPWQIYPLLIAFVLLAGATMALMTLIDKDMEKRGISKSDRVISKYLGFWPTGVIKYLKESRQDKSIPCPYCGQITSVATGSGKRKCVHCKKEITDQQVSGGITIDRAPVQKAIQVLYFVAWLAVALLIAFIVLFILK